MHSTLSSPYRYTFLYVSGFTPLIRSSICAQNESTPVFVIFLAFWEFQMGHAVYQIKPKTPSKLKNAIKMMLNTLDSQNLAQKQQVDQLDPSGILVEWLNFFGILQPHHCHHSL